jgi:hypothetical protein
VEERTKRVEEGQATQIRRGRRREVGEMLTGADDGKRRRHWTAVVSISVASLARLLLVRRRPNLPFLRNGARFVRISSDAA